MASRTTIKRLPRTRYGSPRLRRTDDVLDYWAERIGLVAPPRERFSYSSMICVGDSLYHYGLHFELARIIRDKRGRTRRVLLNGDSYGGSGGFGPSTSSRQGDARAAVARTGVEHLVVPFSALEGAGIDFGSITLIDVRDDRFTLDDHASRQRPADLARMDDPSGAMRTKTYDGYDVDGKWRTGLERDVPKRVPNPNRTASFRAQHGWCDEGATRGEDGTWRWRVRRHWLGDSLFRARTVEQRTRPATADELADFARFQAWEAEANRLESAQTQLAHKTHLRWAQRGEQQDYGRLFRLHFATGGLWEARQKHGESRPLRPNVRNGRAPITVTRWATFLSSFDYQEPRPLYFLCELPYGAKPNTVDEAIEALKPPEVIAAQARGLAVLRQGDLFAIPTKLNKRQIRRLRGRGDFTKRLRILGTNHSVTEGIICKGGGVLGRGIMRHEPEAWRPPDHVNRTLGDRKVWHLLVRNTVPRTR